MIRILPLRASCRCKDVQQRSLTAGLSRAFRQILSVQYFNTTRWIESSSKSECATASTSFCRLADRTIVEKPHRGLRSYRPLSKYAVAHSTCLLLGGVMAPWTSHLRKAVLDRPPDLLSLIINWLLMQASKKTSRTRKLTRIRTTCRICAKWRHSGPNDGPKTKIGHAPQEGLITDHGLLCAQHRVDSLLTKLSREKHWLARDFTTAERWIFK